MLPLLVAMATEFGRGGAVKESFTWLILMEASLPITSCRNRHRPKRQSMARARWLLQQASRLIPVPDRPCPLHHRRSRARAAADTGGSCAAMLILSKCATGTMKCWRLVWKRHVASLRTLLFP